MLIEESFVDLKVPCANAADTPLTMRAHVFRPVGTGGSFAAIAVFSEIYQVTGPVQRLCRALASEGFIVAAGECYHEFEEPGTILKYNPEDTDKGNKYKISKTVEAYDRDAETLVQYLKQRPDCNGMVGSTGMCLGGHLSLRASFIPDVKASVCLFATDVHSASLGLKGDDSLKKIREGAISNDTELVMIWGKQDTHCPPEGRKLIRSVFDDAQVDFSWCEFNTRHAFIRDELSKGRYDASIAAVAFQLSLELFRRRLTLGLPSMSGVKAQTSAPGPANC